MNNLQNSTISIDSEQTLKGIFDMYYHPLCFYALRFLKDEERVKDVVQDVFLSCWSKRLNYPNHYALKAYLYSSVYHSCLDSTKTETIHKKHHDRIRSTSSCEQSDYLALRIETEALEEIFKAVASLPHQCKTVFTLSYIEGKSIQAVAQELNISPNTVKTQRARAKKLLQERLKRLYGILAILFVG